MLWGENRNLNATTLTHQPTQHSVDFLPLLSIPQGYEPWASPLWCLLAMLGTLYIHLGNNFSLLRSFIQFCQVYTHELIIENKSPGASLQNKFFFQPAKKNLKTTIYFYLYLLFLYPLPIHRKIALISFHSILFYYFVLSLLLLFYIIIFIIFYYY